MKRILKIFAVLGLVLVLGLGLGACHKREKPTPEPTPVNPELVTITFNVDGKEFGQKVEIEKGTALDETKAPKVEVEGKTFKHCSLEENGVKFDFKQVIEKDTTLYAVLEAVTPIIKMMVYFKNGDETIASVEVVKGEVIPTDKIPADPEAPSIDKVFDCWKKGAEPFDLTQPINETVTLVASFKEKETVKINFMINGTVEHEILVYKGSSISSSRKDLPAEPEDQDGKEFIEWQLNGETFDENTVVNEEITVEAYYAAIVEKALFSDLKEAAVYLASLATLNLKADEYMAGMIGYIPETSINESLGSLNLLNLKRH